MIRNPILPGFNPDPSICRVGNDYYIATSTFEWYPGVQIHQSSDLVNWDLVTRPLNRASQLDMRGNPDSGGIWAPCLSHADGRFWLVYTDVKRLDGAFKDAHNYIVTCETIDGDWSDPTYVNSSGFDPSLFHDDDGRKWFVNVQWNHRGPGTGGNPAHASFDGILLQEWAPDRGLFGPIANIYHGSPRGLTEAPHLFKRNGWYYLTVAEGGTGYDHAVTMARSRRIEGPYETQPDGHLMSAADAPGHPLQRTGHGQYVETPDGAVYHTFLMSRPLPGPYSPLGRETGIEKCVWHEDWLYLEGDGLLPRVHVPSPVPAEPRPFEPVLHDFGDATLPKEFQWLRTPEPDRLFRLEPGALVLTGRESLGSWFEQSLVARRQEHLSYRAETCLEFVPTTYQQAAGLVTYYNRHKFHAFALTQGTGGGPVLTVLSCAGDWPEGKLVVGDEVPVPPGPLHLRVVVAGHEQYFEWSADGRRWEQTRGPLNAAVLSDEGGRGAFASFTGNFVGMFAFDTSGQAREARFTKFLYDSEV
ncbi:MAG: glycoside hydrolase family 43 protein [Pseudomonadota bacterium]